MPSCYPPNPVFGDGQQAERVVWEALREQLPDDAALFYAVRLTEGERHQEIDLLVAWPTVGIAAIEVAGRLTQGETGQLPRIETGQLPRIEAGSHPPKLGPDTGIVEEVRSERHMLQRILDARRSPAALARTVHMVALPHTPVPPDWNAPFLPRALVIDRADQAHAVDLIKRAIEEYGKEGGGDFGHGREPLTAAGLTSLVDILGGQMPSQAEALLVASSDDERRLGHVTRDQARVLDVFEHYPRLTVTGVAGSGKTWLALEIARRRGRAGDRVAMICRSRGLSRYLQRVVERWDQRERPAFIGIPQELLRTWGVDLDLSTGGVDAEEYWSRVLPDKLYNVAVRRPEVECFDALIVDEGHEFGEHWWPALVELLREPMTGTLVAFTDSGHSDEWRRAGAPIDVAPMALGENVRSSRQIARLSGSFTLEEFLPRGRKRADVRFVDVPADYAASVSEVAVEALRSEGWAPGAIAVLSTGEHWPAESEAFEGYEGYWDHVLDARDVHRGNVRDFEGLERPVVVVVVNGFDDPEHARQLLYLGISRARNLLVVIGPAEVIEDVGGDRVRKRLRKAEAWSPNR
jgi:hypothetical protein